MGSVKSVGRASVSWQEQRLKLQSTRDRLTQEIFAWSARIRALTVSLKKSRNWRACSGLPTSMGMVMLLPKPLFRSRGIR